MGRPLALAAALALLAPAARAQMHVDGAPARTLDWGDLAVGPEAVVYFGDVHGSVAIKRELAAAMPDFADAGAVVLAVEMLHVSDQPLLNAYGTDPAARAAVGKRIADHWRAPAETYLALLDAAKAAGLELVALNPDSTGGEKDDSYSPDGAGEKSARNARMAAQLAALARRHLGHRVLVFIGADHARAGAQPAQLKEDGIASRSYAFVAPGTDAARLLSTAQLSGGRWLMPGGADFTGLIAVPDVLAESSAATTASLAPAKP
jgi:hypothetical protein